MGTAPRDEDGYLRAVAETLTEWNSPEDEDAWGDDDGYLRAVAETLTEWNSPEDENAWRDL